MDLEKIEKQLQKRWNYPYRWGRKQNDRWDSYTAYIYKIKQWDHLIEKMKESVEIYKLDKKELFYYAANRWYNYWSARVIEDIFVAHREIVPAVNSKDKYVDFICRGVEFDHKTSIFPSGFGHSLDYAQSHKKELIRWFYDNQSHQQREHFRNRLFVVVFASNGQHWKIKARLRWLKTRIDPYIQKFDPVHLPVFNFYKNKNTIADIIWAVHQ